MSYNPGRSRLGGRGSGGSWRGRGEASSRARVGSPSRGRGGSPITPDRYQPRGFHEGPQHSPSEAISKLETRIIAQNKSVIPNLKGLSLHGSCRLMPRPGYSTAGQKVNLWANYFEIEGLENIVLYQHSVILAPDADLSTRSKRRLLSLLIKQQPFVSHTLATNYVDKIICTKGMNPEIFPVRYYEEDEEGSSQGAPVYQLTIQLERVFCLSDLLADLKSSDGLSNNDEKNEAIQALNMVLAHFPNESPNIQFVGQSKHFTLNPGNSTDLGGGLDAIRGFFHSVRPSTGRMLLNLNVSTAAFYHEGNLCGLVARFDQERKLSAPARAIQLDRFLRRLRVKTNYLKSGNRQVTRVKTIMSLVMRNGVAATPDNIRFQWANDGRTRDVSVREYFLQAYNVRLTAQNQIVVNVGKRDKPIYLPAEVCQVVSGQVAHQKLSSRQTSAMIKIACRPPPSNANEIVKDGLSIMGIRGAVGNQGLGKIGIRISSDMLAVTGMILRPPRLKYKTPLEVGKPGVWNMSKGVMFNQAGSIPSNVSGPVGCLTITSPWRGTGPSTTQFMAELGNSLRKYGINWPNNEAHTMNINLRHTDQENDGIFDFTFAQIKEKRWAFTIVVLPEYDAEVYSKVKYYADVKHGFHTLCVVPKLAKSNYSASSEPTLSTHPSYLANLALKINLKLAGVNHQLEMSGNTQAPSSIMYIGIDVTHPTGTESIAKAPSIAGVVANCDHTLGQWPASIRTQDHRVEIVQNLTDMVIERLKGWKTQKFLPDKIVVYRDGVSESQYEQVLDTEFRAIKEAVDIYYRGGPRPKVTIIIVGKRHHTRFYPVSNGPADPATGNVMPGTVVDRGCTMVRNFDFFMVAHAGIQGTSRPAHYVVLRDENGFTADALQAMTHNLSYVFGRATRSVSIATPAYYADILCERGRCYLYDTFHRKDQGAASYDPTTSRWLAGVHKDLVGSMFYI